MKPTTPWTLLAHGPPDHLAALGADRALAGAQRANAPGLSQYTNTSPAPNAAKLARAHPHLSLVSAHWDRPVEVSVHRAKKHASVDLGDEGWPGYMAVHVAGAFVLLHDAGRPVTGRPDPATVALADATALAARQSHTYLTSAQDGGVVVVDLARARSRVPTTTATVPDLSAIWEEWLLPARKTQPGVHQWRVMLTDAALLSLANEVLTVGAPHGLDYTPRLYALTGPGVTTVPTTTLLRLAYAAVTCRAPEPEHAAALAALGQATRAANRDITVTTLHNLLAAHLEDGRELDVIEAVTAALT